MILQPYFHVGIAVADLDEAMAQLAVTGLRWRKPLSYPLCVFHGGRDVEVGVRSVYSAGPGPAIELFSAEPGTPLDAPTPGSGFHHIGAWADDFAADVAQLRERGWDLAATVADEAGEPSRFSLHRTPFGFYLELVDPDWAGALLQDLLPGPAETSSVSTRQ